MLTSLKDKKHIDCWDKLDYKPKRKCLSFNN